LSNETMKSEIKGNQQQLSELRQAIKENPYSYEAYYNLGSRLCDKGLFSEAADMLRKAIKLNPDLPRTYNKLGVVLQKANMFQEAAELFTWAVKLKPTYIQALNNLSTALLRTNRLDEAEECLRQALKLDPQYAKAYNNLGMVLEGKQCYDEALVCFRKAIILNPNDAVTYTNLGKLLKEFRQLDEAENCLQRALTIRADSANTKLALATLYLLREQYEEGWEAYDDWWSVYNANKQLPIPRWRGEALQGRRILLFADQGFGDCIHFIRYVPKIAGIASETSVLIQKPLRRLVTVSQFGCNFIDNTSIDAGAYDFISPLLRLPYIFNTLRETIPQQIPYLYPGAATVREWNIKLNKLDGGTRYRIGVVWAGNPAHYNDRNRSIPFDIFRSLFEISGVSWISLQKGKKVSDLSTTPAKVTDVSGELTDFAETAGVIANLDLVITVDSAVAHLAGAMGKKTWILLPFTPDWRWQLERDDSPWYPTMRLFRQHNFNTWVDVLARVKKNVMELL